MTKLTIALAALCAAAPLPAQQRPNPIIGTWQTEKVIKDAPATVIVRADSSASYGTETVRWRITAGNKILLALGGEWVEYDYRVRGNRLTLSGGDLQEAITLRRTGPATPRPAEIPIPPDPDLEG
ncbi:MAG TPA: hypothetical protein VFS07_09745 [Gemmatimonadales bacterium]|nr:hypothetical protein [Gemmatimonadales bacterium]